MRNLLGIMDMMGNYDERKVARFEDGDLVVSTAAVTDSAQPFETAVSHPAYNNDQWVIVEMYETRGDAEAGHERWVKKMTGKEPPKVLRDVSTAGVAELCDASDPDDWRNMEAGE